MPLPISPARASLWTALLLVLLAQPALAAPFDGRPKLLLHVRSVTTKNACAAGSLSDCGSAVTKGNLAVAAGPYYFAYLLGTGGDFDGFRGVQFGIDYENSLIGSAGNGAGLDIYEWHHCGTVESPTTTGIPWPEPGSGNMVGWNSSDCQTDEVGVVGYFYVGAYAADSLRITVHPSDHHAKLVPCTASEVWLGGQDLGFAVFSSGATTPGCNPCSGDCPSFGVPRPPYPPPHPEPPPTGTGNPSLLLHLQPPGGANPCVSGGTSANLQVITSGQLRSGTGPNYFAFLLATPDSLPNIAGGQCGIDYDGGNSAGQLDGHGIDILAWHLCATLEFPTPTWPAPHSANLMTWDAVSHCQTAPFAVLGYFYLTAWEPGALSLIPRPVDNRAVVASCSAVEARVNRDHLGYLQFSPGGTVPGCNPLTAPCGGAIPVTTVTWSRIKSLTDRH